MTSILQLDSIDPSRSVFRTRPSMTRLFAAVGECCFDSAGNAIDADVRFLERSADGVVWGSWQVGQNLHWHPFRLRLSKTARAGLHITAETGDGRYLSNLKIREAGVFVLNPSNAVCLAEPIDTAVDGDVEGCVINDVLRLHYGLGNGYLEILKIPLPCGALRDPSRFFLTH